MIRVDAPQRSPGWFAARLGKATGSGFSCVLAKKDTAAHRNYLTQLALEKITGRQFEGGFTNEAMRQGVIREPIARRAYEAFTGNLVEEVGFCLHDALPCGVSPDGLIDDDAGLEIKCPTPGKHAEYLALKGAPTEYRAQIQGCLWVSDRARWDFVSFCPEFPENARLILRAVERDEAYIAALAQAVADFMGEVDQQAARILNFQPTRS